VPEARTSRAGASPTVAVPSSQTPWHLWVVAILTLLWNGSGAVTIMLAQAGRLPGIRADEAAYYAAQPLWLVILTDIATLAPVAAGIALLLRSQAAVWLFALSLVLIVVNNAYELVAGTSRALVNQGALIVTAIIVMIAVLQLVYSNAMKKRGVLR
jgi:hypothetical protein